MLKHVSYKKILITLAVNLGIVLLVSGIISWADPKVSYGNFFLTVSILVFISFLHNRFLLNAALVTQQWKKYFIRLLVAVLFIFPFIFTILSLLSSFIVSIEKSEMNLRWYFQCLLTIVLFIVIGGGIYFVRYYFRERRMRLETELNLQRKQLALLRTQLNPHFLFNALNSIKSLTASNPERARHAIVLLSDLLRKSLSVKEKSIVLLKEEINTVQEYLELEQLRYGGRLQYTVACAEATLVVTLPAMSLQLLVENAVKHGVDKNMGKTQIDVRASNKDSMLVVEVENTGSLINDKTPVGIGLQSITEQLQLLYGGKARFTIQDTLHNTVLASIIIPTA